MNKKIFLSIVSLGIVLASFAGKGTDIKITVKGLENTKMILANYYGDKEYVKDSLLFNQKGTATLKMDTLLPGGVYLAVFPAMGNRYFEFILNEPQFTLETDTNDLTGHMKVIGSVENELFYKDMHYLSKMKEASDSVSKLYKAAKDPKEKENYRTQLTDMDKDVKARRGEVIEKYPTLFYAKLLKAMKDIDVPEAPKDANGKIDSTFQWRYYKSHYWDYVDLKDERLLRCPVFHGMLKKYMGQIVVQTPDSINAGGEDLLAKTDMKNDIYRYIVTYIFNEAANSKVMCFDAVYVHYGSKYFCDASYTPWIDSVKRFKICDRVQRLKPVLCDKKAQSLILPTDSTETQWKSLYDIKAKYTILAFWDPDCGHCKKEIPVLLEAWHNLKKKGVDVGAYCPAIMEIEAYKDWVEFIQKNNLDWINVCDPKRHNNFRYEWDVQSTPQVYILDSNKNIKARRIGADQVEDYILHLENPAYFGKLSNKINESDEEKQEGSEK